MVPIKAILIGSVLNLSIAGELFSRLTALANHLLVITGIIIRSTASYQSNNQRSENYFIHCLLPEKITDY